MLSKTTNIKLSCIETKWNWNSCSMEWYNQILNNHKNGKWNVMRATITLCWYLEVNINRDKYQGKCSEVINIIHIMMKIYSACSKEYIKNFRTQKEFVFWDNSLFCLSIHSLYMFLNRMRINKAQSNRILWCYITSLIIIRRNVYCRFLSLSVKIFIIKWSILHIFGIFLICIHWHNNHILL